MLEDCARLSLEESAPRAFGVLRPIKLTITNWPGAGEAFECPAHPRLGAEAGAAFGPRRVTMGPSLFIDRDDFRDAPTPGFNRLVPGGQV